MAPTFTGEHMHSSVRRLFAAFLLALAVLPLSAVSASAATYTITGRITGINAAGVVTPMAGTLVEAEDADYNRPASTYTDSDGYYTMTLPAGGAFAVRAACEDEIQISNCQDYAPRWFNTPDGPVARGMADVVDGTPTVANMQMRQYGTVKGRVVDSAGNPVTTAPPWLEYIGQEWFSVDATVDANGYYTIPRVHPGDNQSDLTDDDQVWAGHPTKRFIVDPGQTVTIDWVLTKRTPYTAAPTPTISGVAGVGSTLTANPGTWSPTPSSFSYAWFRISSSGAETQIIGANDPSYQVVDADRTHQIRVEVTAWSADQLITTRSSAPTAAVQYSFTTAPTPTITGTRAVGYTLTASTGTWSPTPDSFAYQWYRAGAAISGATASTYTLTSSDKDKAITVRVTARKAGYVSTARTSAATGAILGVYSTAPTPTISGTKAVGYTLTANAGTWSPTPTSFTYQWYRGSTAITGATYRTYKLTSSDKGQVVKVKVRPVLTGYYSPGKYSAGYTIS